MHDDPARPSHDLRPRRRGTPPRSERLRGGRCDRRRTVPPERQGGHSHRSLERAGRGFAQALAEAGANVALGARRVDRLSDTAELVAKAGRQALTVPTDVGDPASCTALVEATLERFGRVDILVNNAGVATAVPATRETPDEFRR